MPIEVEIKVAVKEFGLVITALNNLGCKWCASKGQIDRIYKMPNYSKKLFWRIREEDGKSVLSVKKLLNDESAIEVETLIDDPNAIKTIFELSEFEEYATVKKQRTECILDEYRICLDDVTDLGCFVEIEKLIDKDADRALVERQLKEFVNTLGLSTAEICRERYHTMMHRKI